MLASDHGDTETLTKGLAISCKVVHQMGVNIFILDLRRVLHPAPGT